MKKSIILEGPNGSGKSTLVSDLSHALGMVYHHAGSDPGSTKNAIKACCRQYGWVQNGCIIDRVTPISRVIYQKDLTIFEKNFLKQMLDIMLEDAVIIYCTAEGNFTNKEYYPKGHYEQIVRDRKIIRDAYDKMFEVVPHVKFDWRNKTISQLIREINDA